MKNVEQGIWNCENEIHLHTDQSINTETFINQFIYDEEQLKKQIKQKYKEHLTQINQRQRLYNTCADVIRHFLIVLIALLQQLWIQIVPQWMRGRYFAQKSPSIMSKFRHLNCGSMIFFLQRMKKRGKYFFIILEQKQTCQQFFEIEENLFQNSEESNLKLSYILQCQSISLNSKDLNLLQSNTTPAIKLNVFLKNKTKCPLLLVCRYNFLDELKVVGEIQLSSISRQNFAQLFEEIKNHIFQLNNLQNECKRQVLTQLIQNET